MHAIGTYNLKSGAAQNFEPAIYIYHMLFILCAQFSLRKNHANWSCVLCTVGTKLLEPHIG